MPYQRVLSTAQKRPRGKKAKQSLNWVVKKGGRSMHGGGGGVRENRGMGQFVFVLSNLRGGWLV
jgi:hypothetical protein